MIKFNIDFLKSCLEKKNLKNKNNHTVFLLLHCATMTQISSICYASHILETLLMAEPNAAPCYLISETKYILKLCSDYKQSSVTDDRISNATTLRPRPSAIKTMDAKIYCYICIIRTSN